MPFIIFHAKFVTQSWDCNDHIITLVCIVTQVRVELHAMSHESL